MIRDQANAKHNDTKTAYGLLLVIIPNGLQLIRLGFTDYFPRPFVCDVFVEFHGHRRWNAM